MNNRIQNYIKKKDSLYYLLFLLYVPFYKKKILFIMILLSNEKFSYLVYFSIKFKINKACS